MSTSDVMADLAVIGGGAGGVGAALAAARRGLRVVLVEKADQLGGNAVRGGVNCWEMGAGGTGIPFDLYRRLKRRPLAVGIYSFGRHGSWYKPDREPYRFPGGEQVIDPARRYLDTLRRHGSEGMGVAEAWCREHWHGVPFEPDAMAAVMREALAETGHCEVLFNTSFAALDYDPGRMTSVILSDGRRLTARYWVDGTADAGGVKPEKSSPLEVVRRLEGMEDLAIEDCILDASQALVTFTELPDTPGVAADVFEELGRAGLFVDMIVQSHPRDGRAELSFTVPAERRDRATDVARTIAAARGKTSART